MDHYIRWSGGIIDAEDNSFDAFLDSDAYKYNAGQHKERLGTWVTMWVFSLFWELLRKPARWLWNTAYTSFARMFQNIGRNTARKLHNNITKNK